MFVAVSRERLAAMRTSVGVYGFSAHLMLMRVPPCLAASRGAELDVFPAGYLVDGPAAALAIIGIDIRGRAVARHAMSLTVCFDGTDRQSERLGNGSITEVFTAQFRYLCLLFSGHEAFLQSERNHLSPSHWTESGAVV